jgi:hypothetical protein
MGSPDTVGGGYVQRKDNIKSMVKLIIDKQESSKVIQTPAQSKSSKSIAGNDTQKLHLLNMNPMINETNIRN